MPPTLAWQSAMLALYVATAWSSCSSAVNSETAPMKMKISAPMRHNAVAMLTVRGGEIGRPSSSGSGAGVIAARNESKIPGRLRSSPDEKLMARTYRDAETAVDTSADTSASRVEDVSAQLTPIGLRRGEELVGPADEHQHDRGQRQHGCDPPRSRTRRVDLAIHGDRPVARGDRADHTQNSQHGEGNPRPVAPRLRLEGKQQVEPRDDDEDDDCEDPEKVDHRLRVDDNRRGRAPIRGVCRRRQSLILSL